MFFNEKLLNRSNSYNYYKNNYELLKNSLKQSQYEIEKLQRDLTFSEMHNQFLINYLEEKNKKINKLNRKIHNRNEYISSLIKKVDHIEKDRDRLFNKYEKDYLFFDFENFLSKLYVSPLINAPFSNEDKRCFAFMDHLAKYLQTNIPESCEILLSIIFPIHNYEEEVFNAIQSILNQSYQNFELIVIDDASDDKTVEIVELITDNRLNLIQNEVTRGLSYCRNIALSKAEGDYIFYFDMGNLWTENYLKTMLASFLNLSDADALYSGQLIYDYDWKEVLGIIYGVFNKSLLMNKQFISLSAFAHKKELIGEIHFDESLEKLEDWYFLLNFINDYKMYSVPILQSKTNWFFNYDEQDVKLIHEKFNSELDFSNEFKLNKKVSIIIPSYELLDDLKDCISTILSFNSELIDIIVVDNNSNSDVKNYLEKIYYEGKIKYISNDINFGFTYAIEQGIEISDKNSDILLLNNDAILTKGALEVMQYYAYNLSNCGIIVPQEVLYSGDERIRYHVPFANTYFECDVTPSKVHKNIINVPLYYDGDILELSFAPFFCTYIKRDIYNQSLGLDAELGRHYRSDRIYSNFVRYVLGLKIFQTSKAKVYHKSQQSTNKLKDNKKDYDMIFSKNQWEPYLAKQLDFKTPLWNE